MVPRLLERYKKEISLRMMEKFGFKNTLQVPRLDKIVINMGIGEGQQDIKIIEKAMEELSMITGQKPIIRRAKKAISNFKTKKNNPVGCKVTLRRSKMYEFLDRLISVALPRIRDFRGISPKSFDEKGNFTLGITEQTIFPDIDYDKITRVQGMDITLVIKNSNGREQSRELLSLFGMPFHTRQDA